MTFVKPHRLPEDDVLLDSETIRAFIRDAVHVLSKVPYDHATGSLPLRRDAFFWLAEYLCGAGEKGIMYPGGCNLPTLWLEKDGTVAVRFVEALRSLTIRVLCKGVVTIRQTWDDGQTQIDRMLMGVPETDTVELEDAFTWLLGEEPA